MDNNGDDRENARHSPMAVDSKDENDIDDDYDDDNDDHSDAK